MSSRRHRFGATSLRAEAAEKMARRRAQLAERTERSRDLLVKNTMSPIDSNIQSETDLVIMEQQGLRRELDKALLADEIKNESGKGLNSLTYYPIVTHLFNALLPTAVFSEDIAHVEFYKSNILNRTISKKNGDPINLATSGREIAIFAKTPTDAVLKAKDLDQDMKMKIETPDKQNKMLGVIKLDERVLAQLSIAASMVVNSIIDNVPSHEAQDPHSDLFQTTRVIYYEDIIKYIHKNYGGVITLDPTPGEAFERMSGAEVNNFARSLLKQFKEKSNESNNYPIMIPDSGGTRNHTVGIRNYASDEAVPRPSAMYDVYKQRIESMTKVHANNVGKVWASKISPVVLARGTIDPANTRESYPTKHFYDYLVAYMYMATHDVMHGNSNLKIGTKIQTAKENLMQTYDVGHWVQPKPDSEGGTPDAKHEIFDTIHHYYATDAACSILTLVAMHVITYALSYAIDAYIRLAIRGADRDGENRIVFNDTSKGSDANVITPQMIFPGIQAALEMYGLSTGELDKQVAFQLRTNSVLLSIFMNAKKAYDMDTTKPGIVGFNNPNTLQPNWMQDRDQRRNYEEMYQKTKGQYNKNADGKLNEVTPFGPDVDNSALLADYAQKLRDSSGGADVLNRMVGREVAFGRRHRRSGRKRRSSKKLSFGKKRRSSRKKRSHKKHAASFGKKRRGSKKRRHSKKH